MQKRFFFRLASLLFVLPFLLVGCFGIGDTVYFSRRTAALVRLIPEATVTGAIKAVPGVTLEPTRTMEPYTSLGRAGLEHSLGGKFYDYHSAEASGEATVTHTHDEGWTLKVGSGWMGGSPSPEALQKSQRLNDQVYLSLRRRYPALPPLDQTKKEGL